MLRLSLCLLVGATLPALLDGGVSSLLPGLAVPIALATMPLRCLRPAAFALLGFGLAGLDATRRLDDRLDIDRHGDTVTANVRIDEFPTVDGDAVRFAARPVGRADLPARLRLTWYLPDRRPLLGETWRLTLRLRYPRGYANPGGFDYEGWLFREGIGATGYVVAQGENYLVHGSDVRMLDRLRRHVDERLVRLFGADGASAVLSAVVIGARHRITTRQWDRFARTGTSHLMAVSGLHIGLAGGAAFLFAWALGALLPGRRNLRDAALLTGVACAAAYAVLSGFAVPARRALLMAAIGSLALLLRRKTAPLHILGLTAVLVILADPGAVLSPGFRLSFAAVAVLLTVARRGVTTGISDAGTNLFRIACTLRQLVLLQLSLLAGLFPLVVSEFGRFSPVAPLVNIIVLPLFNFAVVPPALVGALLDGPFRGLGDGLLALAKLSLEVALAVIDSAGDIRLPGTADIVPVSLPVLLLPLLVIGLPPGWPGRSTAIIAIAAVVLHRPPPPPEGCVDYHVLDVGQGLAVVLQTERHSLLYDTGPSFRHGGSAARFAVLPFLRRRGVDRLDEVIVSHGDLDHAGGIRDVIRESAVGGIRVGENVAALGRAQRPCTAGDRWDWDGVSFALLHPRPGSRWQGNNASCVLEVSAGAHRLLLTGDIEAPVEKLLAHRDRLRAADVVIVPHHGSRTSSTRVLITATRPGLAIVSAGFRNRWNQPAAAVVRRWQQSGARVMNTADTGAVSQRLCAVTGVQPPRAERFLYRRVWHQPASR